MKTTDDTRSKQSSKLPHLNALAFWALLSATLILVLSFFNWLPEAPDKMTYDWRIANFSDKAKEQRKDIAVVLINDQSLDQYYTYSPIDRGLLAELVRAIDKAEPAAIGLDFIFDRNAEPEKTNALIDALQNAKAPIVLGAIDKRSKQVSEKAFKRQEEFLKRANKKVGHLYFDNEKNPFKIDDNIIRFIGETSKNDPKIASFAETLARIKSKNIAIKSNYIAWQLKPDEGGKPLFPTLFVPEHAPVSGNGNGETVLPDSFRPLLKNKIVLVGGSFIDRDQHLTPLSFFGETKTSGVYIHAQIIAQLLDDRWVQEFPKAIEFVVLLILSALGFFLGYRFKMREYDVLIGVLGIILLITLGVLAFAFTKTILPSTTLSFAWGLSVPAGHIYRWYQGRYKKAGSL